MMRAAVVLMSCVAGLAGCAPVPRPVVAYVPAPSREVVMVTSVDRSSYYLRDGRAYYSLEEAVRGNAVAEAHAKAAAAPRRSSAPSVIALVASWLAPPTFLVVEDRISDRGVSVADAAIAGGILIASLVAVGILAPESDDAIAVHRMNAINIYNEGARHAAQQAKPQAPEPSPSVLPSAASPPPETSTP